MQQLFKEFKPNTAAEWKQQLIKDLKGESYENLVWQNENGFKIRPFYTAEDLKQTYDPAFTHAHWEVCVSSRSGDAKKINLQFLEQLNSGAGSVSVNAPDLDPAVLLKGIRLNYIHSSFFLNAKKALELKNYLESEYDLHAIHCSVFPEKMSNAGDLENWKSIISAFKPFKTIKTICADALSFHNQGCLAYYEVAIIMSLLTEYLESLTSGKQEIPAADVVVKTGVSSDYFLQIAKLRAIRRLWEVVKTEYGIKNNLHMIVETSLTNKSVADSYNNLLRTTVEAMAAVSGGCNELIVTGFDVLFPSNAVLSERMAVNQQLILKEESYFDKMADTACGSFYIESITDAIASKALETFKRFEKEGGYFKCLEKNIFSNEISMQAKARQELVDSQKQVFIGVNKFKNEKEKISLDASQIEALKNLDIQNPALNFELQHYFNLKNA